MIRNSHAILSHEIPLHTCVLSALGFFFQGDAHLSLWKGAPSSPSRKVVHIYMRFNCDIFIKIFLLYENINKS